MREKKTCRTDLEDTMILGRRFDHDHVKEEDRTIEKGGRGGLVIEHRTPEREVQGSNPMITV